jgi:nucleosome binding factor SPN SPT16 subunit
VDSEKKIVAFPLFGAQVPIPVSSIKSVSFTPVEGDYACLRVDFLYPGASFIKAQEGISFPHPDANFIKEM